MKPLYGEVYRGWSCCGNSADCSRIGFKEPDMTESHSARKFSPIPNRLFGAEINHEGDAT